VHPAARYIFTSPCIVLQLRGLAGSSCEQTSRSRGVQYAPAQLKKLLSFHSCASRGWAGGRGGWAGGRRGMLRSRSGPLKGPRGPLKGPRGSFKGSRGPFKGPRGPFKGPQGPLKGPQGPLKGPRGPFKGPRGPFTGPQSPATLGAKQSLFPSFWRVFKGVGAVQNPISPFPQPEPRVFWLRPFLKHF